MISEVTKKFSDAIDQNNLPCCRMLDELEGPGGRASREFRQKFPDEIVTDNLGGQVKTALVLQFC